MLHGWSGWKLVVDTMTGGGGCRRRRKNMGGVRGNAQATAEQKRKPNNRISPNSDLEFTKKPSSPDEITKLPFACNSGLDFFTQARKALSFRSPFDSDDSQAASNAALSSLNTLPSGVSQLLKHSDSRKRHKKSHSGSEHKSSSGRLDKNRGANIWVETEEYFRELSVDDIERLERVSNFGFSGHEHCFIIPPLHRADNVHGSPGLSTDVDTSVLRNDCISANLANGINCDEDEEDEDKEGGKEENEQNFMDVGIVQVEDKKSICKDNEKREAGEKGIASFSGIEWLLGSRSKIYLASERPSKKRKLLGREAGLERLLVACPVESSDALCHYCSLGDRGDQLNPLIKCGSCGMLVHQRCYGVQEDVDNSWKCAWCKVKKEAGLNSDRPCLLCPQPGGALKPVQKRADGSEDGRSGVEFAHLFCSQWIPEIYVDNTRTMEPITNIHELKETRKKLICYLCKVKCGACVRCSNGACRTSFHPICAREARHRMEIWGKLGCDEVELRAFCSKHSEVSNNSSVNCGGVSSVSHGSESVGSKQQPLATLTSDSNMLRFGQRNGDKMAVQIDHLNENGLHENSLDSWTNSKSQSESEDTQQSLNDNEDMNACDSLNFIMILKKLIERGKVNSKDVASDIGVSADSLHTLLADNHMLPELHGKIVKWLRSHAYISSLQKPLKVKIKSSMAPKEAADAIKATDAVSVESDITDVVPFKSVPPRRRTQSNIRIVKDDKFTFSSKKNTNEDTIMRVEVDNSLPDREDLNDQICDAPEKVSVECMEEKNFNILNSHSNETEGELSKTLVGMDDGVIEDVKLSKRDSSANCDVIAPSSPSLNHGPEDVMNRGDMPSSNVHPLINSKLIEIRDSLLVEASCFESDGLREREISQLAVSSSLGICCNDNTEEAVSAQQISEFSGVNFESLLKASNGGLLKLSPSDEVEGELIYYQHRLLCNVVARKRRSADLINKVLKILPLEIDAAGKQKWDAVLVSKYNYELREAKKQGRKERRHKEAQAVLAAATAAAAASSRTSSTRKDAFEESAHQEMSGLDGRPGVYSQQNPRVKETLSRSAVRPSSDKNSDRIQLASDFSKEHPRACDICRRAETMLNPILVCSSCKVAVHLDCYRGVKSSTGPWHCELCEYLRSSRGSGVPSTYSWEKPYFVAECGLCGGTAGAFRKSIDDQWIHPFCAEWVLESSFRRGQVNPIEGMEKLSRGCDLCIVCHRKQGVCLKCSYGHCQSTFHPTCARSAGFYMTVRIVGGKLQHKAYCEKHSLEQRAKADAQKHGLEEFKSLKQVRVELERLRLLCERIIKREKLKRELVLCSHDILASSRDSILSTLARHPFYQPDVSSESATTSVKGYPDGCKSGSETMQRSDDITVDSTVAGKRCVRFPISMENDQKTDDSSTSQTHFTLKPMERVAFSGKQIPHRASVAAWEPSDDGEKRSKCRKHTETLEKELVMTSDQASMKNQRLPKGFVYVPVRCLSKEKETIPDACSREPVERNG